MDTGPFVLVGLVWLFLVAPYLVLFGVVVLGIYCVGEWIESRPSKAVRDMMDAP